MRSKFAAAQSGLRQGKSVPFTGFPDGKPVNGTDFPWLAHRGLHSAPPIPSLNR
jgi:hypothetical protein